MDHVLNDSIIPSTSKRVVPSSARAVVPSSARARISGVAKPEEFKAHQGNLLRIFSAGSFTLLVGVGMFGWNCLMAANGGGKGVKLNGGVRANGAARPSGGVFKNSGIKFPPWVCGRRLPSFDVEVLPFQNQDD